MARPVASWIASVAVLALVPGCFADPLVVIDGVDTDRGDSTATGAQSPIGPTGDDGATSATGGAPDSAGPLTGTSGEASATSLADSDSDPDPDTDSTTATGDGRHGGSTSSASTSEDGGVSESMSDGAVSVGSSSDGVVSEGSSAEGSSSEGSSAEGSSSEGAVSEGSSSEGSSSDGGTTGEPDGCGDGDLDDGELCDDGDANGTDLGDCAPDCSAFVTERTIEVTLGDLQGDFAVGDSPVALVDQLCVSEFGAGAFGMFAFGDERVASVTPLVGDGQVDWVLDPWTRYVNADGALVWITNEVNLIGVEGGALNDLLEIIWTGDGNHPVITGMDDDWTTVTTDDCDGWSSITPSMSQANPGFVTYHFLHLDGTTSCGNDRAVYCVLP